MTFGLDCRPAFNFARDEHTVRATETGAVFETEAQTLALPRSTPLSPDGKSARAEFQLKEGGSLALILREVERGQDLGALVMTRSANNRGLYAEEPESNGEALENFPQAFTHFVLISAAFNLDRALGNRA